MSNSNTATRDFDLQPDPRILPMLGEINLDQWRCLAELVDNSVDGFLSQSREGTPINDPEVVINIPTADVASARVTVRDNGPGMTPDTLEKAVRAGWTGNSPIGSLGMFGMGFNIATARLGVVTTVWTATPTSNEWHGLKIDFDELRKQRHFKTPRLSRPKVDSGDRGTEVTIEHLKPEQRLWLAKPANLSKVRQSLSEAYGAMLRANGVPISFKLMVNGKRILPKNHCVWDESRFVDSPRFGAVHAIIRIDKELPDRPYCTACWQWLASGETLCPSCGTSASVVQRRRHVHGWIGLQRYFHTSEYGFDFIRNGRKIEIANKELFQWKNDNRTELEYPIDDYRSRGRFIGEMHLDHCRVSYMKDRFDRTDPAWEEMVRIVRGEGPLRPEKAASEGYGPNESPLFILYQMFRRFDPHNKRVAGCWAKNLSVKDNDHAEEMARRFFKGEAEYQTDQKWWELVVEEDNKLLTPQPPTGVSGGGGTTSPPSGGLPGFTSGGTTTTTGRGSGGGVNPVGGVPGQPSAVSQPARNPITSLTREYRHDGTNIRWDVRAYSVLPNDPAISANSAPWCMKRLPTGEEEFYINIAHSIFRSATMTPIDALLSQLAWSAVDLSRGQPEAPTFASVIAGLRERYATTNKLDPIAIKSNAEALFGLIAKAWAKGIAEADCRSLFEEDLTQQQRDAIYNKMAARMVGNPNEMVNQGRFLEFAPPRVLADFVVQHPELFFDGRCWEDSYSEIDFPNEKATEEARLRVVRSYEAMLLDAVWIMEQESVDLAAATRERLLRAALALELLIPRSGDETASDE